MNFKVQEPKTMVGKFFFYVLTVLVFAISSIVGLVLAVVSYSINAVASIFGMKKPFVFNLKNENGEISFSFKDN